MVKPDDNQTLVLEISSESTRASSFEQTREKAASNLSFWGEGSKFNVKRRMKSLTVIDHNFKAGTPQLQLSDPVIYRSIKQEMNQYQNLCPASTAKSFSNGYLVWRTGQ